MRNIDKIRDLKEQLSNAQRYAGRLEAMCKGQDRELEELRQSAREVQEAADLVMMAAVLEHGEAVKQDQTGETVGWRLRVPAAGGLRERYQLHARLDREQGGMVLSVLPRKG